ncbi:MAG: uracil-xanthine permease family protein [Angelakisella sp.]
MEDKKIQIGEEGIFDARRLGMPKMLLLGFQHVFAMFGATVLVPIITGLSVSTTLLMAGVGTLLFHLITKGKVPAFLGSSFAFLGGFAIVAPKLADANGQLTIPNKEMLPYACGGVMVAGLVYVVVALLIQVFGVKKVMRFFPPVVTGPIIISIGLILAPSAINNASTNWLLAVVALSVIIICNIWGKGMIKIIPILLGVGISYLVAVLTNAVDFTAISQAGWFEVALKPAAFAKFEIGAILTIMPIALAAMMEHIGDMAAISATTGKNYIEDPGLARTLMGDGLATSVAGFLGGPANTTYGENTGVLALTKVYDPAVVRIAALVAIVLSFIPKFDAVVNTIPVAIIGGISLILYGMISAIGVRNVVENQVDFTKSRNLIIAAVILVTALGFNSVGGLTILTTPSFSISLSGLSIAAILGISLNAILPGNDYEFGKDLDGDTSANFQMDAGK